MIVRMFTKLVDLVERGRKIQIGQKLGKKIISVEANLREQERKSNVYERR